MDKRFIWLLAGVVVAVAAANPLSDIIQKEALKQVNKVSGNIATGSLENTTIDATAVANGDNSYAAAGGIVRHSGPNAAVNNKQRAEVNLEGAQVTAHAEAANGNKAFAGAYVNK